MHCEGKYKLRSDNTSYCLIEVVIKAGLTVLGNGLQTKKYVSKRCLSTIWSNAFIATPTIIRSHVLFVQRA